MKSLSVTFLILLITISLAIKNILPRKYLLLPSFSKIGLARSFALSPRQLYPPLPTQDILASTWPDIQDHGSPSMKFLDNISETDAGKSSISFLNSFISSFLQNKPQLMKADPCTFAPCGANTQCEVNTKAFQSRICTCNQGFVSHPSISETCVRPCLLKQCGINALCVMEDNGRPRCLCQANSFFTYDLQAQNVRCVDPCHVFPCFGKNTFCLAQSANRRVCMCRDGTIPTNDIDVKGCVRGLCSTPGICNPTTQFCTEESGIAKCNCLPGFSYDKTTSNCVKRPCYENNVCGPNSYCTDDTDPNQICNCIPGYFRHHSLGCVDPCEAYPCDGPGTICLGLSPKSRSCVCKTEQAPIRPGSFVIGCEDACNNANCGAKSRCINNKCTCDQGLFPMTRKHKDQTSPDCIDPCLTCRSFPHTVCNARSASDYDCLCASGYLPKQGDAKTYGCSSACTNNDCKPNEVCIDSSGEAECICILGLLDSSGDCTGCYFNGIIINVGTGISLPDDSVVDCAADGTVVVTTQPLTTNYATSCISPFSSVQGGCYYASPDTSTGEEGSAIDARKACIGLGGDLAIPPIIYDRNSFDRVLDDLGATIFEYWVGGKRVTNNDPYYTFIDSQFALFPLDSPMWDGNQPNEPTLGQTTQECLRIQKNQDIYEVHDKPCIEGSYSYICEIPGVN